MCRGGCEECRGGCEECVEGCVEVGVRSVEGV